MANELDNLESSVRSIHAMHKERDELREEVRLLKAGLDLARTEREQTTKLMRTAQSERDHYMRRVVELMTQISAIQSIVNTAAEHDAVGAYRDNGGAAKDGVVTDPIPKFLTTKPQ